MKITVKLFAGIKDLCGFSEKELIVSEGITIENVLEELSKNFCSLNGARETLLYAVNGEYRKVKTVLADNDILAIFPPVSGG